MVICVASEHCKSNSKPQKSLPSPNPYERVHFFNVPKDEKQRLLWQKAINRPNFELKHGQKVCHKHFWPEEVLKHKIILDAKGNDFQKVCLYVI